MTKTAKSISNDAQIVQVQGEALRVPGSARPIQELLARHDLQASVSMEPANLEEAFVSIVTAGTSR